MSLIEKVRRDYVERLRKEANEIENYDYADAIGMDLINEIGMIKLKCPFKYDKKIKRPICWNISCDECWRNALEQEGE